MSSSLTRLSVLCANSEVLTGESGEGYAHFCSHLKGKKGEDSSARAGFELECMKRRLSQVRKGALNPEHLMKSEAETQSRSNFA